MPNDWEAQISEIQNFTMFNGTYVLSEDNESLQRDCDYNDLCYLLNTTLYDDSPDFPWFTSVTIQASDADTTIIFYSEDQAVHQVRFEKNEFKLKNNALILNMKNPSVRGGMVSGKIIPTVKIFKGNPNELFVGRKETFFGNVTVLPAVVGGIVWFKLEKVGSGKGPASASKYPARNPPKIKSTGLN